MYLSLLIVTTFIYFVILFIYLQHHAASAFHPLTLYLAFHGLVFMIRPWTAYFYQYRLIYEVYRFIPDAYAKNMALVVANVGLVAFAWASLRFGNQPMRFRITALSTFERGRMVRPFVIVFLLMQPWFLYSIYLGWFNRMTDKSLSTLDKVTGVLTSADTNGYAVGGAHLAVFLLPLLAWLFRFRLWVIVVVGAYLFVMLGMGTRGPTVMAVVGIALFYLYEKRRKWFEWKTVIIVVLGISIFSAIGFDRGRGLRMLFVEDSSNFWQYRASVEGRLTPLEGMDFGNLEMVEFLTETVPRKTGTFEYFVDQLQLFTEPIPRALWEGKPIGKPVRLFNLFDYGHPIGATWSMPGEGWLQLGLAGVVLWCGAWGAVIGRLYNRFACGRQTVFKVSSYFILLSMMIVCYRDGTLLSVMRYGLFAIIPMVLWYVLANLLGERQAVLRVMEYLRRNATHARGENGGTMPGAHRMLGARQSGKRLLPARSGPEAGGSKDF